MMTIWRPDTHMAADCNDLHSILALNSHCHKYHETWCHKQNKENQRSRLT